MRKQNLLRLFSDPSIPFSRTTRLRVTARRHYNPILPRHCVRKMNTSASAALLYAATISTGAPSPVPTDAASKAHHKQDGSGFVNPWPYDANLAYLDIKNKLADTSFAPIAHSKNKPHHNSWAHFYGMRQCSIPRPSVYSTRLTEFIASATV